MMNKNKLVAQGLLMNIKKSVGSKRLLQTKKSLLRTFFFLKNTILKQLVTQRYAGHLINWELEPT
jgi:hypothetical protein